MRSRDSLGRKGSREIKRAMFERTQSMDFDSMMKFFGAPEPTVYEDVEEIPERRLSQPRRGAPGHGYLPAGPVTDDSRFTVAGMSNENKV